MPDFIRLPGSIINLSLIREIEFEGDVIVIHWLGRRQASILRGDDAEALLRGIEQRYGLLTDAVAQWREAESAA